MAVAIPNADIKFIRYTKYTDRLIQEAQHDDLLRFGATAALFENMRSKLFAHIGCTYANQGDLRHAEMILSFYRKFDDMDKFSIYLSIARKLQETGQSAQFARYTAIVPTWVKKKFIKEFKLQKEYI